MSRRVAFFTLVFSLGCGARTGTLSLEPHTDAARVDAGPQDGGHDAAMDANIDGGHDGGFDGGPDTGFDGGHDVGIDTNPDTGCMANPDLCLATESCTSTADDD
jgi:hypothetical protein